MSNIIDNENNPPDGDQQTHFGYQTVASSEKESLVKGVFDSVADQYDLMNDLMSGGVHRLWKRVFVERLNPRADMKLLDLGGGTGDIAFRYLTGGGENVVVCDINQEMLSVGRDRALDKGILDGPRWICGNAESLPLDESSVDAYTSAFCLRNVTKLPAALAEARRVLRPGGRFLCLEFSQISLPLFDRLYDLYSFNILPLLGQVVAKDRDAYQYLAESIRRFPPQEEFASMIADSGLENVSFQNLSGGIVAIHSAWRI